MLLLYRQYNKLWCVFSVYAFDDLAPPVQTAPQLDRDLTATSSSCTWQLGSSVVHLHISISMRVFQSSFSVGTTLQYQTKPTELSFDPRLQRTSMSFWNKDPLHKWGQAARKSTLKSIKRGEQWIQGFPLLVSIVRLLDVPLLENIIRLTAAFTVAEVWCSDRFQCSCSSVSLTVQIACDSNRHEQAVESSGCRKVLPLLCLQYIYLQHLPVFSSAAHTTGHELRQCVHSNIANILSKTENLF